MNDKVFQLRSDQLANLLSLGADPPDSRAADDRPVAEVLAETLAGELPLDVSVSDSMPAVLGRSCDELMTHRGRTVCQFLSDPQTDVASLRTVKDYAKELVRRSPSEATRAVATALYYAAIAAALAHRGEKITLHQYATLERSFTLLAEKPYATAELKSLFGMAREVCRARTGKEST